MAAPLCCDNPRTAAGTQSRDLQRRSRIHLNHHSTSTAPDAVPWVSPQTFFLVAGTGSHGRQPAVEQALRPVFCGQHGTIDRAGNSHVLKGSVGQGPDQGLLAQGLAFLCPLDIWQNLFANRKLCPSLYEPAAWHAYSWRLAGRQGVLCVRPPCACRLRVGSLRLRRCLRRRPGQRAAAR